MSSKSILKSFAVTGEDPFRINEAKTTLKKPLYLSKGDYRKQLAETTSQLDDLQNMMYAHDRHAMVIIFQAMDAAGKDGTIRAVMSGVNPHGVTVHSFKKPSSQELDHDFLWRTTKALPERGRLSVFNRSYYEEVLVTRVHPEIVTDIQRLPGHLVEDMDALWASRYEGIRNLESFLAANGVHVVKFFLNLSKEEQRQRFLARLNTPSKNWKFTTADVKERAYWNDYMDAYEQAINATATKDSPWYVIPADDKKNMRMIVSQIILERMRKLEMAYPARDKGRREELDEYRKQLEDEA
ncbi:MAG: PPK2 family polyphosphate:nucleotide phosphotransferase [Verrucomicrobiales bacterium]|jgi:PPK2 family polyphosphate:nucleotide phosphotransferase